MDKPTGRLHVVATPIGDDRDLSPRARDVLARADMVLAEDTRRAGLLFQRLGIEPRGFMSLFEHNEEGRVPQVLEALADGCHVALVSDAGTPLMSDPGYRLVRACREAGYTVMPVPGPSAPLAALMACGLPPLPFTFLGFVPRRAGQAERLFAAHAATGATLVFFERKDRLAATLETARRALGEREAAVARELTKTHEEILTGRLGMLAGRVEGLRGEVTVVVAPGAAEDADAEEADRVLAEERAVGGKPREVARRAAARLPGWTAKALYERLLA